MAADRDADPGTLRVDLAWQSVVVASVAIAALVVVWGTVRSTSTAVTVVVVALFLAMALDPLVVTVGRHARVGRGWATVLVLGTVTVLFAGFVAVAGPQLVRESATLEQQLPDTIDSLEHLPLVGDLVRSADLSDRVSEAMASLPETLQGQSANLGRLVERVGFGLGEAMLGFFLVAGALFEGPRMVADVRRAVTPARREDADAVGRTVYQVLARYFAGTLLIAIANGMWVAVVAMAAGVPLSPVLGVWSALTAMIPQIGGLLGFALVLVVSLSAGVVPAIVMSVAFLAFMLFSNHVLVPTVVGRAVSLSAPVTMLAAIGGFSVAGVVGALFSVPTIGAIKAVAVRLRDGPPAVEQEPPSHPGRVARLRDRLRRRRGTGEAPSEATVG